MKRDKEMRAKMPDPGARAPAEGDVDFDAQKHVCCPDEELSSELPVEQGALATEEGAMGEPA